MGKRTRRGQQNARHLINRAVAEALEPRRMLDSAPYVLGPLDRDQRDPYYPSDMEEGAPPTEYLEWEYDHLQLRYRFDQAVTVGAADLLLTNLTTGEIIPASQLDPQNSGSATSEIFRFINTGAYIDSVLPTGNYDAVLNADNIKVGGAT